MAPAKSAFSAKCLGGWWNLPIWKTRIQIGDGWKCSFLKERRRSGPYISFRLKHRLFLSQQLMKHQRIQVKSKKTLIHVILPQPKSAIHQAPKKNTNVFSIFPKTKHLRINHRKKNTSISASNHRFSCWIASNPSPD